MAQAPTFEDPQTFDTAPAPEVRDTSPWPSGWWIIPAVGIGLWVWIKIFAWMLF